MKRTPVLSSLLAAAVLAIGGCASKEIVQRPVVDIPPGSFAKAWEIPAGVDDITQIYLADKTLFVYGKNNQVSAFDGAGGLKFRADVGSRNDVVGPPMVQADRILFPTSSALEILAINGNRLSTMTLPHPIRSPGVAIEQTVYLGSDSATGGRLTAVALDRRYHVYRWEVLTRSIVNTKPAVHDNVIYAATNDGRVYALNTDRTPLWPMSAEMTDGIFHTDGKIEAAIKADEGGVYIASTDTKLYCLDLITGRIRWQYIAGTPLKDSPVPTSDTVYQYVRGRGLSAIDKKPGVQFRQPRWTNPDAIQLLSDDAKFSYVLTKGGRVLALDKATGAVKFQTERDDFVKGVTHVDPKDSTIYVLTENDALVAFRPVHTTGIVGELVMLTPDESTAALR